MNLYNKEDVLIALQKSTSLRQIIVSDIMEISKNPMDVFTGPESFVVAHTLADVYGWFHSGIKIVHPQLAVQFENFCTEAAIEYEKLKFSEK